MRIAVVISHPIQYYAPFFRELATRHNLHVFHGREINDEQRDGSDFGISFAWDIDLLSGYSSSVLLTSERAGDVGRSSSASEHSIFDALRRGGFDAVLVVGWYQRVLLEAIIAGKRLGIPVLMRGDSHLGTPRSFLKHAVQHFVYPVFFRLFDAVLYVGAHSRAYFERYHYPADRFFASPHCVDTVWFAQRATDAAACELRTRLGVAADAKLVLFAGKLVSFKRPADVLEALAILSIRGERVLGLMVGSGPLEESLRERAVELGVSVRFMGFQNQTQMPAAYAAADVLVLPSTGRETWGLVCNEALACGTPVIVSDAVGCAPDLACDGVAGRMFPVGDTRALAEQISAVLTRPPSREAIRHTSDRFSVSAAVDGVSLALQCICLQASRRMGR